MDKGRDGRNNMGLKNIVKGNDKLYAIAYELKYWLMYSVPNILGGDAYAKSQIKKKYFRVFGREVDLENPKTLTEKIQWLKLNVKEDFHTQCADKYLARNVWKKYGEDGLIPLLYQTYDYRDITVDVIPDVPCIIKCNTGSATYKIIRSKKDVDIKKLQYDCRRWMVGNYYYRSQEWQYKNIKPCIIIEKLLLDSQGHIPNDYKLNYINGNLEFIYCSIDREGENYRSIYSPTWERLDFEWVAKQDHKGALNGADIPAPKTLERMIEIGADIAKKFHYVRVDFYEVDEKLYYGEITLHHGSGFDTFEPEMYDWYYGEKLKLGLEGEKDELY